MQNVISLPLRGRPVHGNADALAHSADPDARDLCDLISDYLEVHPAWAFATPRGDQTLSNLMIIRAVVFAHGPDRANWPRWVPTAMALVGAEDHGLLEEMTFDSRDAFARGADGRLLHRLPASIVSRALAAAA
jgi:hypothetical protein